MVLCLEAVWFSEKRLKASSNVSVSVGLQVELQI